MIYVNEEYIEIVSRRPDDWGESLLEKNISADSTISFEMGWMKNYHNKPVISTTWRQREWLLPLDVF